MVPIPHPIFIFNDPLNIMNTRIRILCHIAGESGILLNYLLHRVHFLNPMISLILFQGKKHHTIDSGITTFCNHGCNGTYNYGDDNNFTELNIDLDYDPEALLNKASVFSPVFERHLRQILAVGDYTLRDIRQGEEILCNYLSCKLIHHGI